MVSALIQELESTAAILTGKKNVVDIENKSLCGSIRKLRSQSKLPTQSRETHTCRKIQVQSRSAQQKPLNVINR